MAHWLDEFPALRIMHKRLDAGVYNQIRIGLLREQLPWRVQLAPIRCLVCILDERAWVCVDDCHHDQPIMAWTNFKIAQRKSLDAPIECELHLFHMHAGLVMGSALDALAQAVADHARRTPHDELPVSMLKS